MLKICQISAELAPFSKTGGLGDVAAALSGALHRAGQEVRVLSPLYATVDRRNLELTPVGSLQGIPLSLGRREVTFSVLATSLPGSAAPGGEDLAVYLIDCPELYDRPSIYTSDGDEPLRFAALSRASLECCQRLGWGPDVVHAHDWHTALIPLYLQTVYAWDRLFATSRTVLTIHNVAFQGVCSSELAGDLGFREHLGRLPQEDLAAGRINFLKAGILYADRLTTVSRTHALEIQTPEYGFGLDGLLRARSADVVGIVNGIDDRVWNPSTDPLIPYRYTADSPAGKGDNKRALLEELGLAHDSEAPLLGIVSRLTSQKGFDLTFEVLPEALAAHDLRLVALGTGEPEIEGFFQALEERFADKVRFIRAYSEELAHRIEAAADLFLMPSRYEPCGLNQMYSQVYGTLPIVRRTGGLADTVVPWDAATGEGTGFVFEHADAQGFRWALGRALEAWKDPEQWRRLRHNAMAQDFSWAHQVGPYLDLYSGLTSRL